MVHGPCDLGGTAAYAIRWPNLRGPLDLDALGGALSLWWPGMRAYATDRDHRRRQAAGPGPPPAACPAHSGAGRATWTSSPPRPTSRSTSPAIRCCARCSSAPTTATHAAGGGAPRGDGGLVHRSLLSCSRCLSRAPARPAAPPVRRLRGLAARLAGRCSGGSWTTGGSGCRAGAVGAPGRPPAAPVASFRGDALRFHLPSGSSTPSAAWCAVGATLFMTLLAVYHALLHRHAGQTDFAIGTPVAGRTRPELEPLIGMFLNMLAAARPVARGGETFPELLAPVRTGAVEAFEHQRCPSRRSSRISACARDARRCSRRCSRCRTTAMPDVAGAAEELAVSGTARPRHQVRPGGTPSPPPTGWTASWCTTPTSSTPHPGRVLAHLGPAAAVAAPPRPAWRRRPARAGRAERWPESGHAAGTPVPAATLARLVERQVDRTPGAVAVVPRARLSPTRAGRARPTGWRAGCAAGGRAGVAGRGLRRALVELVVALLAMLKAGGAYLPLDPGYPAERWPSCSTDAGPAVVLTRADTRCSGSPAPAWCL